MVTINNCVFTAMKHLVIDGTEQMVAEWFDWKEGDWPPDPHRIIDALMARGWAVTPIDRHPRVLHLGKTSLCYTPEMEEERFETYLNGYCGLTVGLRPSGLGHMAYFEQGVIIDGSLKYTLKEAPDNNYDISTLLVTTWQN